MIEEVYLKFSYGFCLLKLVIWKKKEMDIKLVEVI